jgi:flagellar assembly protein FliH
MSSKLVSRSRAEAWEPMPWSLTGTPLSRPAPRNLSAGQLPPAAGADPSQTLHADIAKLEQDVVQARTAARAEGEAHGRQQAQAELQPVIQKLAAAIHETAELRGRLREQAESDLVRLAIAIARKILGREITADPEAIAGVVKASLERLRGQEILRVRLHPDCKSKVAESLARFGASHAEVLGDPGCERGTVIFETTRGNLDASIDTQLREIERGLADRF